MYDLKIEFGEHIWAKASNNIQGPQWSPLTVHAMDTAMISEKLWDEWVPKHSRDLIVNSITGCNENAVTILKFLSAVHDVGKATPAFQRRPIPNNRSLETVFSENLKIAGLRQDGIIADYEAISHSIASEAILERNGIHRSISSIVGSHHGNTPTKEDISKLKISSYPANTGFEDEGWTSVQNAFVEYAAKISNADLEELKIAKASVEAQVLLSSIVILSDWISSNETWFPMTDGRMMSESEMEYRIENGWNSVAIPRQWHALPGDYHTIYERRFGFVPRPFQKELIKIASEIETPGIIIVEAPMGEGKTEAALAASEILSERFGMGGAMFALPTQSTADGMFPRMKRWIDSVAIDPNDINSIFLAHGKSRYNSEYTSTKHIGWQCSGVESDRTVIHEWFSGKKKGLLSDFAIGTVDNVLMCGLKMRHLALRHLALTNKVVIIDECHAYDSYMGSYLVKAVEWLGIYRVPVIIMSATLFPSRRKELIKAYLGKNNNVAVDGEWISSTHYPSITFTDSMDVKQYSCDPYLPPRELLTSRVSEDELEGLIAEVSRNGGYIGIMCNTVSRAQKVFDTICNAYPEDDAFLLHSKYTCLDRSLKESEVLSLLSDDKRRKPPYRMFIVGTQVMEQSLDLDFDVLITDICPVDLLLQRMGRLHRHNNQRPEGLEVAKCYIIDSDGDFDKGSEYVYGRFQLYNTRILVSDSIVIPNDIPKLVHAAYSGSMLDIDDAHHEDYVKSFDEMQLMLNEKERMAKVFQICDPWSMKDMVGWLSNGARDDVNGDMASATVRDTNGSVEAIAVRDNGDGTVSPVSGDYLLRIDASNGIDDDTAFMLAGCKISLPARFASDKMIGRTIAELGRMTDAHIPGSWRSNGWLKDELFMVFEPDGMLSIGGIKMQYTLEKGLVIM